MSEAAAGPAFAVDTLARLEELTAKLPLFTVVDKGSGGGVEEYRVEAGTCFRFSLYSYGGLVSVDRFYLSAGTRFGPHTHRGEVQVIFVYVGTAVVTLGDEEKTIFPGESIVIPADIPHNMRAETEVRCISICYPAGRYCAKGVSE